MLNEILNMECVSKSGANQKDVQTGLIPNRTTISESSSGHSIVILERRTENKAKTGKRLPRDVQFLERSRWADQTT